MNFTTGTTDVIRKHNRRVDGPQPIGNWVYQVGLLHSPDQAVAIGICVIITVRGQQQ